MALESSRRDLQLWFRPSLDQTLQSGDMSSQSSGTLTRDSFGTPTWESREKEPFECSLRGVTQGEPHAGREATSPSSIKIIDEVQGGEVMPLDGGIVRPENVEMKPFFRKGELNA
jgi:hypothetical protein